MTSLGIELGDRSRKRDHHEAKETSRLSSSGSVASVDHAAQSLDLIDKKHVAGSHINRAETCKSKSGRSHV